MAPLDSLSDFRLGTEASYLLSFTFLTVALWLISSYRYHVRGIFHSESVKLCPGVDWRQRKASLHPFKSLARTSSFLPLPSHNDSDTYQGSSLQNHAHAHRDALEMELASTQQTCAAQISQAITALNFLEDENFVLRHQLVVTSNAFFSQGNELATVRSALRKAKDRSSAETFNAFVDRLVLHNRVLALQKRVKEMEVEKEEAVREERNRKRELEREVERLKLKVDTMRAREEVQEDVEGELRERVRELEVSIDKKSGKSRIPRIRLGTRCAGVDVEDEELTPRLTRRTL